MLDLSEFEKNLIPNLIAEGMTDTEIGERVGRSPECIRKYRVTPAGKAKGVTSEVAARIVELRRSYVSIVNISKQTGRSRKEVKCVLVDAGLPLDLKGKKDHSVLDAQVEALHSEGASASDVAKAIGANYQAVRSSLKRQGLWVPLRRKRKGAEIGALEPASGELVVLPSQPSLEALESVPDETVTSEIKSSEFVVSSPLEEVVEDISERCEGILTPPDGMASMYLEQIYLGVDYLCASDLAPEKKVEVLHAVIRFCSTGLFSAEASKEVVALLRSGVQQVQGASSFVDDASHYRALIFSQVLKIKESFEDSVYVLHAIIYYCIEKTWGEYKNG